VLERVAFRLDNGVEEIRYLEAPPKRGARLVSRGGRSLVVARVERDPAGGYIATCLTHDAFLSDVRAKARSARKLASDLRLRAADVMEQTRALVAGVASRERAEARDDRTGEEHARPDRSGRSPSG